MSYCRKTNDSDVYVYGSAIKLVCCNCSIMYDADVEFDKYSEMIAHLKRHESHGHKVPARCFDSLEKDKEIEGDIYNKKFKKRFKK